MDSLSVLFTRNRALNTRGPHHLFLSEGMSESLWGMLCAGHCQGGFWGAHHRAREECGVCPAVGMGGGDALAPGKRQGPAEGRGERYSSLREEHK